MTRAALAWCPFADEQAALVVAKTLLDEKLIACANVIPRMISVFDWDGKCGEANEAGMLVKTEAHLLDRAIARIAQLHPYDTPAVVGWCCDGASAGTLGWLGSLGK